MYAVTVNFTLHPGAMERFMPLMRDNAQRSLVEEPGCLQFDICTDPDLPDTVFLYELYQTRADFDLHLESRHFKTFSAAVAPLVLSKQIQCYARVVQ